MVGLTNPFVAAGLVSVAVAVAVALVVWRQRDSHGARAYALLFTILALWSALYVGQLLRPTVAAKRPWLVARHALSPAVAVAFWVFAARFTDRERLLARRLFAPMILVGAALALAPLVDPAGRYWRGLTLTSRGSLPLADVAFGPLFWLLLGYVCLVVGVAHTYVGEQSVDALGSYRGQSLAVNVAGLVGFGTLVLYLTEHVSVVPAMNPFPNVQLLTYVTTLVLLPRGWIYYRDAMLDFRPLAHRTVVGNMDDAVFVLDTDGVVRKANGPARSLVASDDGETIRGTPLPALLADRPALVAAYRTETGFTRDGTRNEPIRLSVDGEQRYYDVRVSDVRNSRDEAVGRMLVARDVTAEADRRARLERKNEQLERLADVVSHDMAAPLSTAEKTLSLLRADLDDPDPAVEQSVEDLATVHDRLRGFADHLPRLARESVDVETTEPCDLADVANAAWSTVETGDLALEIADTCTLAGDRRRLQQVFENLFRNAVTYGVQSPEPSPARERPARRTASDSDGSTAVERGPADRARATTVRVGTCDGGVFVEDDGPGIDQEQRDAVFEYGMSTGEGSGFGLAIVRTIVEAHGWEIEANEGADGGARFDVRTEE